MAILIIEFEFQKKNKKTFSKIETNYVELLFYDLDTYFHHNQSEYLTYCMTLSFFSKMDFFYLNFMNYCHLKTK